MCDVTFVPESIYHKIPCVEAVPKSSTMTDVVKVVHPQFAKLDIMNMLCDLFNSHWRLEYVVRRMLLMEQNFTSETNWVESGLRILEQEQEHPNPPRNGPASCNDDHHLLVFRARAIARSFFASRSSRCVMVGECALDHFMNAVSSPPSDNHHVAEECDVSVMCTSAFIEDITADTEWRAFRPLLGLLDGRSEVSLHGHIIAIAFDSHTRVVPSCGFMTLNDGRQVQVRLRVASFTQTLLNARALQMACEWEGYSMRSDAQHKLCTRLLVARDNARNEAMQETTASASPWSLLCPDNVFRDFYLDYLGQPQHPMRVHMGRTNERIANAPSDSVWFSFDPHHTHQQRPHGKHFTANSICNSNLRVGKRTFARVDGFLDKGEVFQLAPHPQSR
eukprot:gene9369-16491_t